ncbi:MAG: hypothetical protein QNJ84_00370 [Alphaproteobacteria bacterium]|nr:hypothetical protein [Alphaproteobacteria bacterium]
MPKDRVLAAMLCVGVVSGCALDAPSPAAEPAAPAQTAQTPQRAADPAREEASTLPPLTVQPVTNEPPPPLGPQSFAPINPVKLAFIWYDLPGLQGRDFVGTVTQLAKSGDDTRMSFALPPLNIACEGLIRFDAPDSLGRVGGDWEITCSNQAQIAGILVPVAGQQAINGQGLDQAGRSVIFSIQTDG